MTGGYAVVCGQGAACGAFAAAAGRIVSSGLAYMIAEALHGPAYDYPLSNV
jgi:hypothetical protein